MAKITGIDGMTTSQIQREVANGAKFVVYPYVISIAILTFTRSSDIMFIPAGQSAVVKGLPYTFLTFFLGWWGFPWGLIRTPIAVITNLGGGKNVTAAVMAHLAPVGIAQPSAAAEFDLGL